MYFIAQDIRCLGSDSCIALKSRVKERADRSDLWIRINTFLINTVQQPWTLNIKYQISLTRTLIPSFNYSATIYRNYMWNKIYTFIREHLSTVLAKLIVAYNLTEKQLQEDNGSDGWFHKDTNDDVEILWALRDSPATSANLISLLTCTFTYTSKTYYVWFCVKPYVFRNIVSTFVGESLRHLGA